MKHEFRCPVCSHVDEVDLDGDNPVSAECPHCGTRLVLERVDRDALTVEVRVAYKYFRIEGPQEFDKSTGDVATAD